jgi:tRNASer (uridine44-2'-O)-methyltransferase
MPYDPEEFPRGAPPLIDDASGDVWVPMYRHSCTFESDVFSAKMMNLIQNPNINSSWLFRADIIYDDLDQALARREDVWSDPLIRDFQDIPRQRTLIRTLVPRNERRDAPINQTCTFHSSALDDGTSRSLVVYLPHVQSSEDIPFYHPKVRGIAHLHEWNPSTNAGNISIHFLPFLSEDLEEKKTQRTAYHLLGVLHKHGQGSVTGYVKKFHHDLLVPRPRFQNKYAELKRKYAANLCQSWQEQTDPTKHVFEDLGIAAFLMELWADMYKGNDEFPGFVDIGCGNGLLVHILNEEGYHGWGFDARERQSWTQYKSNVALSPTGTSLEQRLLLPSIIPSTNPEQTSIQPTAEGVHSGVFPAGTFILSNHADELTPWTPILAAASGCPFIMIPCCSHDLSGNKFRAPPPRDKTKASSTYASLVDWVSHIAEDCGWSIETELLRIPSTRNIALLGRQRSTPIDDIDVQAVIQKYGNAAGFRDNVIKLLKGGLRGH